MSGELSVQVGIIGAEQLIQVANNLGPVATEPLCFTLPVAEVTEGNSRYQPDNTPGSNKYSC